MPSAVSSAPDLPPQSSSWIHQRSSSNNSTHRDLPLFERRKILYRTFCKPFFLPGLEADCQFLFQSRTAQPRKPILHKLLRNDEKYLMRKDYPVQKGDFPALLFSSSLFGWPAAASSFFWKGACGNFHHPVPSKTKTKNRFDVFHWRETMTFWHIRTREWHIEECPTGVPKGWCYKK